MVWPSGLLVLALALSPPAPSGQQSPRALLTDAAFQDRDKGVALQHIAMVRQAAANALKQSPTNREAAIVEATAFGYRAKLTGSRKDAVAARKQFETLVAREPRNPETQAALGAWHIGVIIKAGGFLARAAVGARKSIGFAALDRSVSLGGNRAMFSGLAALLRLELDPADPKGRALAEAASHGATPTEIDRVMQHAATAILVPLRAGNQTATRKLAAALLPFGRISP